MRIRRSDIVLANLPFSDMSGSKMRPALVVQGDTYNMRLKDVIVAVITRSTARASSEATQLLIDIATPEGRASRLLHTSAVKCEHSITIEQHLIQRVIGRLSPGMMQQIDACLKAALQLS